MRQQYTCIFARTIRSRIWAMPASWRCVWLWLKLSADPEGYVCASPAGVAIGAQVSLEEARDALASMEATDPDADPEDQHEGRIIERVPRGWKVLDHTEEREQAKRESANARQREYMKRYRKRQKEDGPANDASLASPADAKVDAPTTIPTPKSKAVEDNSCPPTPQGFAAATISARIDKIPEDWTPSAELRADAAIAGVVDFDARLAKLRLGPIGGRWGVFPDKLEDFIRTLLPNWKTWGEQDRAKERAAKTRNEAPPSSRTKPWEEPEPLIDIDLRVLDGNIKRYIADKGLGEWGPVVREWLDEAKAAGVKLSRPQALKALKLWLAERVKARAAA
jgi:hypothetical protein